MILSFSFSNNYCTWSYCQSYINRHYAPSPITTTILSPIPIMKISSSCLAQKLSRQYASSSSSHPHQHGATQNMGKKKPLSPSQVNQKNSLNQKTNRPLNPTWDGEFPAQPIPTKNKEKIALSRNYFEKRQISWVLIQPSHQNCGSSRLSILW